MFDFNDTPRLKLISPRRKPSKSGFPLSANGTEILIESQRRSALLAPKMLSKRRSGARVEKWMKNGSKNDGFFNGKTFQNYALCNEFKVFAFS